VSEVEPLPYLPGRSVVVLHEDTAYPDGTDEMRSPHEVGDDYYVETNLNQQQKKQQINELARECGLNASFDGDWTE
jgi:hypothetical protein